MDLIDRKYEVVLLAPTGPAADSIGSSTYHTSLGISLNRYRLGGVSPRVRRLWSRKTIMIIDEISMVDLAALSIINTHYKIARSLGRSSTDDFGGLPVVILMGDYPSPPPRQWMLHVSLVQQTSLRAIHHKAESWIAGTNNISTIARLLWFRQQNWGPLAIVGPGLEACPEIWDFVLFQTFITSFLNYSSDAHGIIEAYLSWFNQV